MNAVVSYNVPHFFSPHETMPWGMFIVVHFFLSGLAAGSFLTSAWASFIDEAKYKRVAATGAYLALAGLILDVPLLIIDLDRPMRFITLLFRFHATAPLTWGVLFITGLFVFSALNIMLQSGNEAAKRSKALILCIGSILAIGVSTYTAVAMNIATNARPFWSNGIIVPIFIAASAMTGIAAVSLIIALFSNSKEGLSCLSSSNAVLLTLQLVMVLALMTSVSTSSSLSREAAGLIMHGSMAPLFWGGLIAIGLIAPMIILWTGTMKREAQISPGSAALASIMILAGVFALRYVIVYGGQIVPLT